MKVIDVEQGSVAWKQSRAGVITGSTLEKAMGKKATEFMYELVAETVAPIEEKFRSEQMERGTGLEAEAIAAYENETGQTMSAVGFCVSEKYPWLGFSPDRLIVGKVSSSFARGVEVKCPMTKTHLQYYDSNKVPPEYWYQVLMYFLVCEDLEDVDFVSYDPRISIEKLRLKIIRVTRAEVADELAQTMEKLLLFRAKWEALQNKLLF